MRAYRAISVIVVVAAVLGLTACGGSSETAANGGSSPPPPAAPATTTTSSAAQDAWQSMVITDTTGASFSLADLAGKPVFVEPFATWCSTCLAQLADTEAAASTLGDEAVFVALSVETDLAPADVAQYAERHGFRSIRFAVMTPELLAAMASALGNTVANPPSTPHLVIAADGTSGTLSTGPASASEIVSSIRSPAAAG